MKRGACNKVCHATKEGAVVAWKRSGRNTQLNAYFCKECSGWHLGSSRNPIRISDRIGQLLDQHRTKHPETRP